MPFLHINPVLQIILFAGLLSVVFPVIGLALVWRISRPDMGYFQWTTKSVRGIRIIVLDVFAVVLSLVIGWVSLPAALSLVIGPAVLVRLLPDYRPGLAAMAYLIPGAMALAVSLPDELV